MMMSVLPSKTELSLDWVLPNDSVTAHVVSIQHVYTSAYNGEVKMLDLSKLSITYVYM